MTELDNAVKKVSDLLFSAARKSGEILENTKISYNISAEKDKISKLQNQIGAKFYKAYKEGDAVPEWILPDLEAIRTIEANILALEKNLSEARAFKVCLECNARLDIGNVYCPRCGAKQAAPERPAQEQTTPDQTAPEQPEAE